MALEFAHGTIPWIGGDAIGTQYTISGLSFQPKALRFYWIGILSATDSAQSTFDLQQGVGFAASTTDRRCVGVKSADNQATAVDTSGWSEEAVAIVLTTTIIGSLDLHSITSDGFVLRVDDDSGVGNSMTVFWEAWGGADITVAQTLSIAEPAATGDQDYTVTGFVSGAVDQVVMFAGTQQTSAAPTAARADAGIMVGAATIDTSVHNIVFAVNSDDGADPTDTDKYALDGECLAMMTVAGGNPDARAALTQWGTDNFRLNWIARGTTNRRYIALAIKGGRWSVGTTTITRGTLSATATVSGLSWTPVGVCLTTAWAAAMSAGTSAIEYQLSLGTGTSTSSRRTQFGWAGNNVASSSIAIAMDYDQILALYTLAAALDCSIDLTAMNSDGFQLTVDDAATDAQTTVIGYVTFGSGPAEIAGEAAITLADVTLVAAGDLDLSSIGGSGVKARYRRFHFGG